MAEADPAPLLPSPEACPSPLPLADAAATRALGRRLARQLLSLCRPGVAPLLLLHGDLGAGKTCLVQGLAEELGITEPITSPTFALAQHYSGRRGDGRETALVHLDLYRLENGAAADELFAQEEEEAMALGALLAVEWPERLSALPGDAWQVALTLADGDDPDSGRLAWLESPASGR
jgi:tRNA threonylcarbamoyladenosine biosynthesis protein TsaE